MAGMPRSRRRRINWFGIIFWLLIFVIIVCAMLLIANSSRNKSNKNDIPTEDVQQNEVPDTPDDTPQDIDPNQALGITPTVPDNEIVGETPEDTEEENTEEEKSEEEEHEEEPEEEEPEEEEPEEEEQEEEPEEETPPPPTAGVEDPDAYATEQELLVATAKSAIDVPYEFGGSGPDSFDTSGLIYYCFREVGLYVPRRVSEQAVHGTEVSRDNLQPGDVVFFYTETEGEAEYVGIYIGNGKFIAARSTAGTVGEMDMNSPYYTERFVTARRYWE